MKISLRTTARPISRIRNLASAFTMAGLICGGTAAHADDELSQVTVTAQRRSESLQDVPISIGTLNGEQLADFGAQGFETIANRIAGLQFVTAGNDHTQLSMRGIVTAIDSDDRPQLNTTVGLYLDDISVGLTSASPNFVLEDLERVEVLRGPQGTLYGAGSEAGTIRLITRKPQLDSWQADLLGEGAGVTGGDANWRGSAVVNAPLIDGKAAVRALGYYRSDGGFLDNTTAGQTNTNQRNTYGGRLGLLFKPTEDLTVLLSGVYQDAHTEDDDEYNALVSFPVRTTVILEPQTGKSRVASATVDWTLPVGTLTSVTGYQSKYQYASIELGRYPRFVGGGPAPDDPAPGPYDNAFIPTITDATAVSQELRLQSGDSGSLIWLLGAFFSNGNRTLTQTLDTPGIEALVPDLPTGVAEHTITDRLYDGYWKVNTRQYAVFGDATWNFRPGWSLSGGLRFYRYRQEAHTLYGGILNDDGANQGLSVKNTATSESGHNPRVNLSYHVDDDRMLYVSAARGFRIGGNSEPIPLSPCGLDSQPGPFSSDKLWNYEVGAKTAWADRRLTVDAALFYIDFKDFQTQTRLDCQFSVISNAGRMVSQGAELEINARPLAGLQLSTTVAYTDSQLKNFVPLVGLDGDRAPYVPRLTLNASIEYSRPLWGQFTGLVAVDAQHVGDRVTAFTLQSFSETLASYNVLNAHAGITKGPLRVTLFGDNLANRHPELYQIPLIYSRVDQLRTVTLRPRTVGLRFQYSVR